MFLIFLASQTNQSGRGSRNANSNLAPAQDDVGGYDDGGTNNQTNSSPIVMIERSSSSSTVSSFKSMISSNSTAPTTIRRSPRKASKPLGWYSEMADFGKEY